MPPQAFRTVLLALLCFLSGALLAATAPAPALPAGVAPLPPESAKHFLELLEAAEKYRGLEAKGPIPAGTLAEPELRRKMSESVGEDLSPGQLKAIETGAKAFGLIPESLDLARYLPELLTSQVAGFYDPVRGYLALVRRDGGGPAKDGEAGRDPEDAIIVHELTHALQDQHFDLRTFEKMDPMSDGATARSALAEGDATLTMTSYMAGAGVETVPGMGEAMSAFLDDPAGMAGAASDLPGGDELMKAPAWIRDSLLFSYVQGFSFCLDVRRAGGQKLLDYAFTTDPPRSSEQILHPEKWHGRRDDPIVLAWPDLSAMLPGWAKVSEGEAGEATIRTLLRESSRDRRMAQAAAAGWGGDRFAVYEKDGRRLLVWWTEWDGETDAREFEQAARRLGSGWRVEALSPRRVQVVRGDGALPRQQRKALRARLAAAEAVPPANRAIDLKRLP
jgi:hypothetical protein